MHQPKREFDALARNRSTDRRKGPVGESAIHQGQFMQANANQQSPARQAAKAQTAPAVNHRTRVGEERRERTRRKLIESALDVYSKKGPDGAKIEDLIGAAGVARGTFYNYFPTTEALLEAVAGEMSDEALAIVDATVHHFTDAAARVACGTRQYTEMARRYPLWGAIVTRIGARIAARGKLLDTFITRDVEIGLAQRRFDLSNALVGRNVVLGSIFYSIETALTEPAAARHVENTVVCMLRGLGLSNEDAQQIAFMELPTMGPIPGSLFARIGRPKRIRRKG